MSIKQTLAGIVVACGLAAGLAAAAGNGADQEAPGTSFEAQLADAEASLENGRYPEARAACERARLAAAGEAEASRAQWLWARSWLQERRTPEARRELVRLLAMPGLDPDLKWEAEALLGAVDLLPRLRAGHPRLFINADIWPAVRARAFGAERALFDRMRASLEKIKIEDIGPGDWAATDVSMEQPGVMEAAFVYRVTGDPAMLERTRRMLRGTAESVFPVRRAAGERMYPSVIWLAALDWVWNDLLPAERTALAEAMLRYAGVWLAGARKEKGLTAWPIYYVRGMFSFTGLALLDPELDDVRYAQALALLGIGFKHYRDRFAKLIGMCGDDGAWQANLDYDLNEQPNSMPVFFHAWRSATGADLLPEWVNVGVTPHFVLRVMLCPIPNNFKHFNYAGHSNGDWGFGQMPSRMLYDHLGQFIQCFGQTDPGQAAIAGFLRRWMAEGGAGSGQNVFPVLRFLMTDVERAPAPELPPGLPVARFFESNGLVLMSSGFGPGHTYALFSQGGGFHGRSVDWDASHFSIFKRGHLALDTGVRFALPHAPNYRHMTVAHNAVLIHMPGEQFPRSASGPVESNAGGQNAYPQNARPLAFETERLFAYTAVDAAPVYNRQKCAQMVRQFVYLPPDHFVVFDRVTATEPDYAKAWLLHTANEPRIEGKEFQADQGEGRLFCRTLLPADAVLEPIGGPGREFWADGKNWPITDFYHAPGAGDWWKRFGRGATEPTEAMGRWRVEVKPGAARTNDVFLHLLQASDQTAETMVESTLVETENQAMLSFNVGSRVYTIALNKTGEIGGHIRVREGGKILMDKDLTRDVQRQEGLALAQ